MSRILRSPLFDIALVSGALGILLGLTLAVNAPTWAVGVFVLIFILVFCGMIVYLYTPPDLSDDAQFVTEGIEDLPGLQDHAEAARRTL